jgi:hypothetical protein
VRNGYAAFLALTALLLATPLSAQRWQTLSAQRQRQDTDSLSVRLRHGAGRLTVAAAPASLLYDIHWRYDADRFRPRRRYDAATHTLTIDADSGSEGFFSLRRHHVRIGGTGKPASELSLGLARATSLNLTLRFGAADANIDLNDLSVSRLQVETAASDTRLSFGTPNPQPMRALDIKVTAATLSALRLGNAHVSQVNVTTVVGDADLDLSGAWAGDMALKLDIVTGGATVRVPRTVGVQVRASKFLAGLDASRMTERDGAYFSDNWERSTHKLTIDASATLAGIELVWLEQ